MIKMNKLLSIVPGMQEGLCKDSLLFKKYFYLFT